MDSVPASELTTKEETMHSVHALLEAGAALPPNAEELEPSDAVLEVLP